MSSKLKDSSAKPLHGECKRTASQHNGTIRHYRAARCRRESKTDQSVSDTRIAGVTET